MTFHDGMGCNNIVYDKKELSRHIWTHSWIYFIAGYRLKMQTCEQNRNILFSSPNCCYCLISATPAKQTTHRLKPGKLAQRQWWQQLAAIPNARNQRTLGTVSPLCRGQECLQETSFSAWLYCLQEVLQPKSSRYFPIWVLAVCHSTHSSNIKEWVCSF